MSSINPQIQSVEIGVRGLRSVTIYPLSMADQFKLSDIITEAIEQYDSEEESSEIEIFKVIIGAIQENLIAILDLVTDEKERITLDELTNVQFANLAEMIYEVNFDSALVKFKSLFEKAKKVFQSKRPQPVSSSPQVTDMSISSSDHSEMGE